MVDFADINDAVHQHGAIYSDSGYALVLTHTHAIVWPYAAHIPSPETFTFALPQTSKHVSDPLPIGSLVSASASSSDPGLVVLIPTSGKITYWESVSSAATMDLRLQRNGVDYTITGMHGGELVTQILNAESAGFLLAFSTGRIAYMSVRDGQGRPSISVQFLRGGNGSATGGLFGSFRNALMSSSMRADIAAVRAAEPERVGERNIVVATTKGRLQSWDIHRGGHSSLNAEADGREALVMAIKEQAPNLSELLLESFEILDFTYTPEPVTNPERDNKEDGAHLLLLTCLKSHRKSHYFLIEVTLSRDALNIGIVRPIKSYTSPVPPSVTSKTRLYLPKPALVAYIVFDRAVLVVSMAKEPDSPDLQLRNESRLLPKSFEDVIDFREDMNVEIVGSGMEEPNTSFGTEDSKSRRQRAKYPATVLIVRGGGVIRVAATNVAQLTTNEAQQVTAKSKLEQAVFFGKKEQNLLNFAVRTETQFSLEEMGAAALELSNEILRSKTPHIASVPASVEHNLEARSSALRDLAEYVKDNNIRLDRVTKWRLLWDAERIKAARLVWERYELCLKEKPIGQKRGLLAEVVEYIHEDYKTEPVAEAGELDRVRHWFVNDIWKLEVAIPWAYQVIKYTYQDGQKDHNSVMQILSEADDLVLAALQGAFEFRTSNLDLYGLGDEQLEHGILKADYEGLPEFWTSTIYITENLRKQAELAGVLAKEYWSLPPKEGQPEAVTVNKVRYEYSVLIDIAIRANTERIRWDLAQDSPQLQMEADQIKSMRNATQDSQIILLATELELPDEAIELAEKHEILGTLAYVLQVELAEAKNRLNRYIGMSSEDTELWQDRLRALRERVNQCFQKFGMKWAAALYEFEINGGSISDLLDGWPDHQQYLTKFLRSRPEYSKISWINEVTREKNFTEGAETLLNLALHREQDKWSKKIQLSIGKIALLADQKPNNTRGISSLSLRESELSAVDTQLGLIKIQDQIHEFVLPSVNAAIDEKAELQLALEAHGSKALKGRPAFLSLLENNMNQLLRHEAMKAEILIDLLTLMDDGSKHKEQDYFHVQQFYLALQATQLGISNKDEQVLLQQIIWRRCMLRDNWADINNTNQKSDEQNLERIANSALYLTLRACFKNSK
jgi:nuclear pore complex protein Nup133